MMLHFKYIRNDDDIEDSSWLRVQDREIFSKRGLKHRAHEVDKMNPISFFVEVHLFKILFILHNNRHSN